MREERPRATGRNVAGMLMYLLLPGPRELVRMLKHAPDATSRIEMFFKCSHPSTRLRTSCRIGSLFLQEARGTSALR